MRKKTLKQMRGGRRVAVVGGGSWGTTVAKILTDAGNSVTIWARREDQVEEINGSHTNKKYLPEIALPRKLRATADLEAALRDKEIIFFAVPSQSLRDILCQAERYMERDAIVVSLMKGVEKNSGLRMSEVIIDELDWDVQRVAVLSGPNIAMEIAREEPTGAVISCARAQTASEVAAAVTTSYFKAYINSDVIGTELGGVLKNLIALAVGIVDGAGYGDNTKASIITRGLAEMTEFAVAFGANPVTLTGLAGLGDLITTCESPLSRNSSAGRMIGTGKSKQETTDSMRQTVEGIASVNPILELAVTKDVEMPIVKQVQMVLEGQMRPKNLGPHLATNDGIAQPEFNFATLTRSGIFSKMFKIFGGKKDKR